MGNSLQCDKCTPAVNHSVFTFSEDLVLKMAEGRRPKPMTDKQIEQRDSVGDQEVFNQLRCIDDSHTSAYGLSPSHVNLLIARMEEMIDEISVNSSVCQSEGIKTCYELNKDCGYKCNAQATEFDQCVDEISREKLKETTRRKTPKSITKPKH